MTQTCGFIYCTHTWRACEARGVFSINEDINTWTTSPELLGVTSWAFDRFIWVKRSSYHIYIGYRNLKGPHGNLSKYKFGLAEYITVYVIQLQQLLQLLLRIITQYAISSMFNSKLICLPKIKSNSHLIKRSIKLMFYAFICTVL